MLSGQAIPLAALASPTDNKSSILLEQAQLEDISALQTCISDSGVKSFVPQNLMLKGFKLNNYEMLVMSELIKRDIQQAPDSAAKKEALKNLVDLQKKYSNEYQMIFNSLPQDIKQQAKTLEQAKHNKNGGIGQMKPVNTDTNSAESAGQSNGPTVGDAPSSVNQPPSYSEGDIMKMAEQYGIKVADPKKAAEKANSISGNIDRANTAQGMSEAMSLINIRHNPISGGESEYQYSNPLNPIQEMNSEGVELGEPNFEEGIETEDDRNNIRSIQEILDMAANIEDRKAKHFFLTLAHSLYYMDSGTEGGKVLNTAVRDDNGNLYQELNPDEHEVQETLEIGLGIRVHKALDMIVSMIAKNENGTLRQDGTEWEFGNVMFKFHPERLNKAAMKRLNSEGIIISDGGRVIGKRIGHRSAVTTDTETGATTLQVGNAKLMYNNDDGFQFSNEDSRYYLGFGKMSLNLSSYTLQLSDCKAVKVGYHDNAQELMLLYGRPNGASEGYTNSEGTKVPGKYQKDIFAAQYLTKNLIPNMELTFNFAKGMDKGSLSTLNGAKKSTDTVYSMLMKGGSKKTSYEGEFAHIKNHAKLENGAILEQSANADYFDLTHQFSNKLRAQLHVINIDGNYDASSLVEDKTGVGLKTTTKGDGTPDYLYQPGQKGLDLTVNYEVDNTASMASGYTNYRETEDGNSKKEMYVSVNKQWSLGDAGTISLQQRFGSNDVSNRDYVNRTSDTTLSYSGSPWKDGSVAADYQKTVNKEQGNETRYDLTVSHGFKPMERVTITPKFQYERKKGDAGVSNTSNVMDTTTIINAVTLGYEIVPDELTVNFLVSKEKYDVIASEIDESTGKKLDGERRNTLGVGLGLVWEPKKIENRKSVV